MKRDRIVWMVLLMRLGLLGGLSLSWAEKKNGSDGKTTWNKKTVVKQNRTSGKEDGIGRVWMMEGRRPRLVGRTWSRWVPDWMTNERRSEIEKVYPVTGYARVKKTFLSRFTRSPESCTGSVEIDEKIRSRLKSNYENANLQNYRPTCREYYYRDMCIEDQHMCFAHHYRLGKNKIYWRGNYDNERGSDRCAKGRLDSDGRYFTHPSIMDEFVDVLLRCRTKEEPPDQYCMPMEFIRYTHGKLGEITTVGIPKTHLCYGYCIGSTTLVTEGKVFKWKTEHKCAPQGLEVEQEGQRCREVGRYGKLLGFGDNQWCYKTRSFLQFSAFDSNKLEANVKVTGGFNDVKFKRRCGIHTNCLIGYCLMEKGRQTECGFRVEPFDPNKDPHPECFLETGNGASLRLSETKWCCRNPSGCERHVGTCTELSICKAPYCIRDRGSTRCPSPEVGETTWNECKDLKWGETRRIPEKNAWCCVPRNGSEECNNKIRACGSNFACASSYCVRKKVGEMMETSCPDEDEAIDGICSELPEGQEHRLSPERVCCKKTECLDPTKPNPGETPTSTSSTSSSTQFIKTDDSTNASNKDNTHTRSTEDRTKRTTDRPNRGTPLWVIPLTVIPFALAAVAITVFACCLYRRVKAKEQKKPAPSSRAFNNSAKPIAALPLTVTEKKTKPWIRKSVGAEPIRPRGTKTRKSGKVKETAKKTDKTRKTKEGLEKKDQESGKKKTEKGKKEKEVGEKEKAKGKTTKEATTKRKTKKRKVEAEAESEAETETGESTSDRKSRSHQEVEETEGWTGPEK